MSPIVRLENFQQFAAINVLSDPGHQGGPVVIPNCVQIMLRWLLADSKVANNIIYGTVSGAFTPTTAICDAIKTGLTTGAAWTALAALFHNAAGFRSVAIRDVRAANSPIVEGATTAVVGTGGALMPDEVALVITLRTAFVGPQNRGRMYIPGWSTTAMAAGGVASGAAVTALQNWANTIPSVLTTSGISFALGQPARAAYTGSTGTLHPARTAKSTPITSQIVRNNTWDTQRRRGLR